MDDRHASSNHVLPGPHREFTEAALGGFVPLRLCLQPGGLCIELPTGDALVGRHSEADLRLALPDISRRHCRLMFQQGNWKVVDLNSLNGVFVNGQRMQESYLYDGDRIRLGSLNFLVQLSAVPAHHTEAEKKVFRRIADLLPKDAADEKRKAS
jgi:pSer/pThr/pTyr-binding forkhead associated (FHA) protein